MLEYLLLIIGFVLLIKGADYLIDGASKLAKKLGISSLIIGLTIVAFGTSLPELIVNITASIKGSQGIVLGNIIGSNLANILLVLGLGSLLLPIKINKEAIKKDWPLNLLVVSLLLLFANNSFKNLGIVKQTIGFYEGITLIVFFIGYLLLTFNSKNNNDTKNKKVKNKTKNYGLKISLEIIGGLIGLYFGSKFVVDNAVIIARNFGVSEFIIGASIVALGTSLPELFTIIIGVIKKEPDLSIGTILGSNLFNILLILGISTIINPINIVSSNNFDLIFLLFITILLGGLILSSSFHRKNPLSNLVLKRWHGAILLTLYFVYIALMFVR